MPFRGQGKKELCKEEVPGDLSPGKFPALEGVEANRSGSSRDCEMRREEIVENSARGMGGSGGEDGYLWWW